MSGQQLFQIDAFTGQLFAGNPAAVVPLQEWLDDSVLQAIAAENNVPETAFFVPSGSGFRLRWFTPETEVKLCGHATLAAAFVLFTELEPDRTEISFDSLSGNLQVWRSGNRLTMRFPRWELERLSGHPAALVAGLGVEPVELLTVPTRDNFFAVMESEAQVLSIRPDFDALKTLHPAGVVVTARGEQSDCVCRYFAPSYGIAEDPGTGSIHCGLVPYWSQRLSQDQIHSRQVSDRGAEFHCELLADATLISGQAVKYLSGHIDY